MDVKIEDKIITKIILTIAGLAIVIATARFLLHRRARREEQAWLPKELIGAEIAYAEKTFWTKKPFPLVARADRGYVVRGEIILTELKTRRYARVYESDVIELSAQKLAIEMNTGRQVSNGGFVLTQGLSGGHRVTHGVRLLSRKQIEAIAKRRKAILEGRVQPKFAQSEGLCHQCSYQAQCRPDWPASSQKEDGQIRS